MSELVVADKVIRSWAKVGSDPKLIGRKRVDWSLFEYGSHIPLEFIQDFEIANGNTHVQRGESREVSLLVEGKAFKASLVNVDRKNISIDTLQLRYDSNNDLKEYLRGRLVSSYNYILKARSEKNDNAQVKVPDDIAEYVEFYLTEEPFQYEMKIIAFQDMGTPDAEVRRIKIPQAALIVAYYLSRFDKDGYQKLGYQSFTQAFEDLADKLDVKRSSLKNIRDQYDSVHDNGRVGWHQRPLSSSRLRIAEEYKDWTIEKLTQLVIAIINYDDQGLRNLGYTYTEQASDDDIDPEDFDKETSEARDNQESSNCFVINPEYTLEALSIETGLQVQELSRWVRAIERKGQAVIYGPPGTGKTYVARNLAKYFLSGADGFADLVQFHPAYAYEDFIQGIRPKNRKEGGLDYPVVPGRFLDFCNKATNRQGKCVLIIDEINRANLSRVFGELMYLLEYRNSDIPLAGGNRFSIPTNVVLIGTMNTADRSIALVDHALRRRFAFLPLKPNYDVLRKYQSKRGVESQGLIDTLERLNNRIADPNYEIGIAFFLCEDLPNHIEDIWKLEIEPYIEEYFFDQPDKADGFKWDKVKDQIAL